MFHWLYKGFIGMWIAALVLSGAAILVGHLRHDPMAILFTNPDGTPCAMPCLFGIRPGATTYTEALALIQSHPATTTLVPYMGSYFRELPGRLPEALDSLGIQGVYAGDAGQMAALVLYSPRHRVNGALIYDDQVAAICLESFNFGERLDLSPITPELAAMWHESSFLQMVVTLGNPPSIRAPHFESPFQESTYFDDRLVILHQGGGAVPIDAHNSYFGTVCVFEQGSAVFYDRIGLWHPNQPATPWQGLYPR